MHRTVLSALSLLVAGQAFAAAPNLRTTWPNTATPEVEEEGLYKVRVKNVGDADAIDSQVVIHLPGLPRSWHSLFPVPFYTLGNLDSRCVEDGLDLRCDLGTLAPDDATVIRFDLGLSHDEIGHDLVAVASTVGETALNNNTRTRTVNPVPLDVAVVGPATVGVDGCSTTLYTTFAACEGPGIQSFDLEFLANGGLDMTGAYYGYLGGSWSQSAPDALEFTLTLYGAPYVEFSGHGVPGDCFEGVATFPGNPYPNWALYRVCLP